MCTGAADLFLQRHLLTKASEMSLSEPKLCFLSLKYSPYFALKAPVKTVICILFIEYVWCECFSCPHQSTNSVGWWLKIPTKGNTNQAWADIFISSIRGVSSGTGTRLYTFITRTVGPKTRSQTVSEHHGEKHCDNSPWDALRTRVHHHNLHLGLGPALHHHRQRTAAAGWDSKSGWFREFWSLNPIGEKWWNDWFYFKGEDDCLCEDWKWSDFGFYSRTQLKKGCFFWVPMQRAACVFLLCRLGVLEDFQEVNQNQTNSFLLLSVVYSFSSFRMAFQTGCRQKQTAGKKDL